MSRAALLLLLLLPLGLVLAWARCAGLEPGASVRHRRSRSRLSRRFENAPLARRSSGGGDPADNDAAPFFHGRFLHFHETLRVSADEFRSHGRRLDRDEQEAADVSRQSHGQTDYQGRHDPEVSADGLHGPLENQPRRLDELDAQDDLDRQSDEKLDFSSDELQPHILLDTQGQGAVAESSTSGSLPTAVVPTESPRRNEEDMLTKFLRIVETQHLLGDNCTAGTDLNLGEGVVDRYAQERFRVEAEVAVNRANMLTRLWKYADPAVLLSEYLLHASVFSMVEFDDDIFAAGNCYDQFQYKDYWLFCPYAYRLPEGPILVKDLAVEYKYLSNTSEWFFIARKNAERVIQEHKHFSRGFHTYTFNESAHTAREPDEILSVTYDDGKWSKPYYDCGGGNIWMLTYTVPFFGFRNGSYFFKGTSGIDIDLRRVDIDQCPLPPGSTQLNIFAGSDKCKKRTTECEPVPGLGFRRGSYRCKCRRGFYFPDTQAAMRHFNGSIVEEEFEKLVTGQHSAYAAGGAFECLPCAEGCDACIDERPCVASLNWALRTAILTLTGMAVLCLPAAAIFTWKYGHVKVVRAASPALLRFIALGAFFIYGTVAVAYPNPNVLTCTARVWLREIGFVLTYGALMLKTWRISVIFRVRSAKAVRISDAALLRRLGALVGAVGALLAVRTLVSAPRVVVGRTAEGLKAPLCRADWWDHAFSALEALFLVWGIRLCIVVRKAPSEFNESRFISMAIYNEFLLSVFLNISMLFLQSPANPDLLYIIFFVHTQLTVTMLLGLIFGSKVWLVMRSRGKAEENSASSKVFGGKFGTMSQAAQSSLSSAAAGLGCTSVAFGEAEVQDELRRLQSQLELLRERSLRLGDRRLAARVAAMQEAGRATTATSSTAAAAAAQPGASPAAPAAAAPPPPPPPAPQRRDSPGDGAAGLAPGAASPPQSRRASPERAGDATDAMAGATVAARGGGGGRRRRVRDRASGASPGSDQEAERRSLKSGHARTHAIVINLDDRSRFTEEVTV